MMFTRITVTEEKQYMRQCLRRNRKKRVGRKKHGFREGRGRTEKNGVRIWGERHEAGAAGQQMTRKPDKVGSWEKGGGSQSEGKREEKRLTARVEEISLLSVCQFDRRKTENSWGLSLHACVCPCVLLPTAKTGCPVFGICEFTPEREREMGGTARTARDQRHTHTCVHTHTHTHREQPVLAVTGQPAGLLDVIWIPAEIIDSERSHSHTSHLQMPSHSSSHILNMVELSSLHQERGRRRGRRSRI